MKLQVDEFVRLLEQADHVIIAESPRAWGKLKSAQTQHRNHVQRRKLSRKIARTRARKLSRQRVARSAHDCATSHEART